MKAQLLMLGAIFLVATSFVSHSLTPPAKKATPKKSAKRCGPSFSITNSSHSTVAYVTLMNASGSYNTTFSPPVFPINLGEQSGFSWTILAKTNLSSHRPVDLVVKDHYTQVKIACYNAAAGEAFSIDFSTGCNWYDLEFSDDTDICGIYP